MIAGTVQVNEQLLNSAFGSLAQLRPIKIWMEAFDVNPADPKLFSVNTGAQTITIGVDLAPLGQKYGSKAGFMSSVLFLESVRLSGFNPLHVLAGAANHLPDSVKSLFGIAPPAKPILPFPCPFKYTQNVIGGAVAASLAKMGHQVAREQGQPGFRVVINFKNAHTVPHLLGKTHNVDSTGNVTVDQRSVDNFAMTAFATNYLDGR